MFQIRGLLKRLKGKLLLCFILIAMVPLIVTGVVVYQHASADLENEIFSKLETVNLLKKHDLEEYFLHAFKDLGVLADNKLTVDALDGKNLYSDYELEAKTIKEAYGYSDVLLINKSGDVVASVLKGLELGSNVFSGKYGETNLSKTVREVLTNKDIAYSGVAFYEPSAGKPASFIVQAVTAPGGGKIGAVAFQLSVAELDEIMHGTEGLGKTGESLWVGPDRFLLSDSRFEQDSILKLKIDNSSVAAALEGKSGIETTIDYRGEKTLSAFSGFSVLGSPQAVITDIDVDEALAPLRDLRVWTMMVTLITMIVVILLSLKISDSVAKPVIGKITAATSQMTAATSEIMAASQQQAASAREQASAIGETTAASKELSKSAESVGESINRVAQVVGHTMVGMEKIKTLISESGKIITSLGEKSQQIGKITEVIDDVADQTNLLAVNAAIEAARAGEQGRGFSVVADEIRKLSDSTAKSTREITALIEEIQHEMTNAIMSMEKSSTSVDEETKLTQESSEKAKEIAMNSTQQVSGARQIADAMESINEAMKQVASGAQQSKVSAEQLNHLATEIKTIAENI